MVVVDGGGGSGITIIKKGVLDYVCTSEIKFSEIRVEGQGKG